MTPHILIRSLDRGAVAFLIVIAAIAVITVVLIPFQWLAVRFRHPARRRIPVLYHRMICALIGVRVRVFESVPQLKPLGVGINVHHRMFPTEIASLATSLRIERGHDVGRQTLLIALLRALDRELDELDREYAGLASGPGLLTRFGEASSWVRGKRVQVPEEGGYTGLTTGLDPRGFLLVNSDDGVLRTVRSGGVRGFQKDRRG